MTWSLVVMDEGITNALQLRLGKQSVFEHDYLYSKVDTDDGTGETHADRVLRAALDVSAAYDVIDLKVGNPVTGMFSDAAIERALDQVLVDQTHKIAAINMSFGGGGYPSAFADEISQLASHGILSVVAAGNSGTAAFLESPSYPAALPDVIAVGSHDGHGNPSRFSQNGLEVDLLADGENVPQSGSNGTSFAAPQVAATVTHIQAIVQGLTSGLLGVTAMVDALQQGGAGPRSQPDPADGHTRYFLHDHQGSLDYAWSHYGGTPTRALEYIASYGDLIGALGANATAGRLHFESHGSIEQRSITFDGLAYIASYGDLSSAFGVNALAGSRHFIVAGSREGRTVSFDGLDYVASYDDLVRALGPQEDAGSTHYIVAGRGEGRSVTFDGLQYIASYGDLIDALGADEHAGARHYIAHGSAEGRPRDQFDAAQYLANYADLRAAFGTDEEAATRHFITNGYHEERVDDAPHLSAADFLL